MPDAIKTCCAALCVVVGTAGLLTFAKLSVAGSNYIQCGHFDPRDAACRRFYGEADTAR